MFIYQPYPVSVQPNMIIGYWAVYRCDDEGCDHFAGVQVDNGDDMVSSAIQQFSAKDMAGVTRSGRQYALVGDPKPVDVPPIPTWARWCAINRVEGFTDVTSEFQPEPDVDMGEG